MADTTTTNYGLVKPEVGGSNDTWGNKTNGNWDVLDGAVKSANDLAAAALPKTGGEVTGALTVSARISRDANFYLDLSGTSPIISWDTGDNINFNRTISLLSFTMGGIVQATISSSGALTADQTITAGVSGVGYARLTRGTASISGFVSFHDEAGLRRGFIGAVNTAGGQIQMANENGATGYDCAGRIGANNFRATGNSPVATSGSGLELQYVSGQGIVQAYTRGTGAGYNPLSLRGLSVSIGTATQNAVLSVGSNNNVGIGTTSADEKLHVVGNVLATGTITAGGDVSSGGNVTISGTIAADGNITTGADLSADGTISAGGAINAGGAFSRDPQYYLNLLSGNPIINCDANDFLQYDRSTNTFSFIVNSSSILNISTAGVSASGIGPWNTYTTKDVTNGYIVVPSDVNYLLLCKGGGAALVSVLNPGLFPVGSRVSVANLTFNDGFGTDVTLGVNTSTDRVYVNGVEKLSVILAYGGKVTITKVGPGMWIAEGAGFS